MTPEARYWDSVAGQCRRMALECTLVAVVLGLSCSIDRGVPTDLKVWSAAIDEEDARGSGPSGIRFLEEGLVSPDLGLQALSVRALGRLEDPEHILRIVPLLLSGDVEVRSETVNALGQAVVRTDGDDVADLLFDHLTRETDPDVRGTVARTLGRLTYRTGAQAARIEETLVGLTRDGDFDSHLSTLTGAVMGLEAMARRQPERILSDRAVTRLQELTTFGRDLNESTSERAARVRRVALMALSVFGKVGAEAISGAMEDSDADVRRLATVAIGQEPSREENIQLLVRALSDRSARVRVEAVKLYAVRAPDSEKCPALFRASGDSDVHVAITALDLLAQPCENRARQNEILRAVASGIEGANSLGWHGPAHALVALASVSPDIAEPLLGFFSQHPNVFVRVYAARAAAVLGDLDALEFLTADPAPNVRTVAVQELFGLRGHDVDSVLVNQLDQNDPFLLITVAGLLKETVDPDAAVQPLLDAFRRISLVPRQTTRDPRMALLNRIAEVGGPAVAEELEEYVRDYDPIVAGRVALIISQWTGEQRVARPNPLVRVPVPSPEEIDRLKRARVILEMARGGEIEIQLYAGVAPTHAARFWSLASSGYFDGLTFHRVVTNFVLQGGSPGANEYSGDAAYTRDELGLLSHWRGTVGTSTRGRDTGDGQIFINLVDNLRLDHDFTVFGEVVRGMRSVDVVSEGDVITRARVEMP